MAPIIRDGGEKPVGVEWQELFYLAPHHFTVYPAARAEPCSDLKGTQTWIVVPAAGFDSIAIVPLTSRTRSRMLVSPRPPPFIAVLISKPAPESLIAR